MAKSLEMAEDHRESITFGQSTDLLVDDRPQLGLVELDFPHGRWLGGFSFDHTTAHAPGSFLAGHPKGYPIEPVGEQVAILERPRLLDEDEERRLKRIFRRVLVAEDATADSQNHRTMSMDQDTESSLARVMADEELGHELAIRPGPHRSQTEERMDFPDHGPGNSHRHQEHSRLPVPISYSILPRGRGILPPFS